MELTAESRADIERFLHDLAQEHGPRAVERIERAVAIFAGVDAATERHPLHRPEDVFFPGITAKPWFEPGDYAILQQLVARLEGAHRTIADEYAAAMETGPGLRPYLDAGKGLDKFDLPSPTDWGAMWLYRSGAWLDDACRACPSAAHIAREFGDALFDTAEVMFSVLQPKTVLRPHHDSTNVLLTVMLPVIVPGECALRVGGETRTLQEGRAVVFDDTFLHEAWNHSDRPRAVFMLDIWHPELTPIEIGACRALMQFLPEPPAAEPAAPGR